MRRYGDAKGVAEAVEFFSLHTNLASYGGVPVENKGSGTLPANIGGAGWPVPLVTVVHSVCRSGIGDLETAADTGETVTWRY